ncbi:hypothetical protein CURTO8I2_180138 [Curtobacterium sp. 8I-2]|nr:hypothetical protein CURTO8I2_180138 [Curtobacterium sp. 8I-2]
MATIRERRLPAIALVRLLSDGTPEGTTRATQHCIIPTRMRDRRDDRRHRTEHRLRGTVRHRRRAAGNVGEHVAQLRRHPRRGHLHRCGRRRVRAHGDDSCHARSGSR